METIKIPLEQLKKDGVKLYSKEKLSKLSPGDWIDCDTLHQSFLHAGYDVTYKNVYEDMTMFIAVFYLDGEELCSVEGNDVGHMIRKWTDLKDMEVKNE